LKEAPHLFSNRMLVLGRREAGGRHGCYQGPEANPAADMFLFFLLHLGVVGAHVQYVCFCCVTCSNGAFGVSELAVRFFVVLVVCHRGAGGYFVFLLFFCEVRWVRGLLLM
jgi:hypothetical protein